MSRQDGKARRRRSAVEKVKILEEGRAPGTTVAEVLRRYQRDAAPITQTKGESLHSGRRVTLVRCTQNDVTSY